MAMLAAKAFIFCLIAVFMLSEAAFAAAAKKASDPAWGFRLGAHYAGLTWKQTGFGMHAGAAFYPLKVFEAGQKSKCGFLRA